MLLKNIKIKDTTSYKEMIDLVYPVGALYWSFNSTSPATLFGGTWVQITNTFIRAENTSGLTGGSNNITLTTNQMPKHNHVGPSHTHSVGTLSVDNGGLHAHNIRVGGNNNYLATYRTISLTGSTNWYVAADTNQSATALPGGATHSLFAYDNGIHNHSLSGATSSSGNLNTTLTGNNEAFNNMPYYTTAYCWRRTA